MLITMSEKDIYRFKVLSFVEFSSARPSSVHGHQTSRGVFPRPTIHSFALAQGLFFD